MGYGTVQALLDRALQDAERQMIHIINVWPAIRGYITLERGSRDQPALYSFIQNWMIICLWYQHIVLPVMQQSILQSFPESDVIIHQDPCSVVLAERQGNFKR